MYLRVRTQRSTSYDMIILIFKIEKKIASWSLYDVFHASQVHHNKLRPSYKMQ